MFAVILAVALVLLFIASVQDIRKREVADYISYTLISASILLRLIWFVIEKDLAIIIYTVPSFAVLFAFSYIMYRFGQWGGGDVKLVAGLSIALSEFVQIFNLFVNFAIIGVLYGVLYTLIRGLRNWKIIADKINPLWVIVSYACIVMAIVCQFLMPKEISYLSSFMLLLVGSAKYIEVIDKHAFVKDVPVSKLIEGDWLVEEIAGIKKKGIGLTKEDIEMLKKKGVKKVKVKEGIPFVPVFLLALLANMLFGNIFTNLFGIHQYLAGLSPIS